MIRWLCGRPQTVEPVKRVKNIQSDGSVTGLGRRKCSSARVWMRPAAKGMDATFVVNGRDYADYFKNIEQRLQVRVAAACSSAGLLRPGFETFAVERGLSNGGWGSRCHRKGGFVVRRDRGFCLCGTIGSFVTIDAQFSQ